jgi:mono/diheme cytochrome c family protein
VRSLAKFLLITVTVLVVVFVAGVSVTMGWRPFLGPKARPLTSHTFERTPQRLERGRYLATAIAGCMGCHSEHEWKTTGEILPGMQGSGEVMPIADLPGRIVAPNLTPDKETGIGTWTDDQLARAIREGVGHDGRALFPMMPYENFRHMSDEDLASIVVFLRSLAPVHHELPKTEIIFPVKYLIRSAPQPITGPVASEDDPSDPVRHGQYLVRMADCGGCHTPKARGGDIPGMRLAGGFALDGPWGHVLSANITPDASGISYYDEALFMKVLHTGYVGARKLAPIMPVSEFKNITDDDMKAMFAYLRTVAPVKHRVDNSGAPGLQAARE